MEIVIIDSNSGSVSLHTAPQSVKTQQDIEDYVHLTLEVTSDNDWVSADKIILTDFRVKTKRQDHFKTTYNKLYVCRNCDNEWTQEQEDEKQDDLMLTCADCLSIQVYTKTI